MSIILLGNSLWNAVENLSTPAMDRWAGESLAPRVSHKESGVSQRHLQACSACAGDYEDPDQTAGPPELEENEELLGEARDPVKDLDARENEFPAGER